MGIHRRDQQRVLRKLRIRKKIVGTALRPRLSVFRSLRHISVQLIDDEAGKTLVAASTLEKAQRSKKGMRTKAYAQRIGELIAERALAKGVDQAVFDRSGYRYHGRLKVLADAARQKGLKF